MGGGSSKVITSFQPYNIQYRSGWLHMPFQQGALCDGCYDDNNLDHQS
jgi:hypothetical protein